MSARALLEELRRKGVTLIADGDRLVVEAPAEVATEDLRSVLSQHKLRLLEILRPKGGGATGAQRRLIARWSEYPVWIELRDPTTGEWHEVRAAECLPGLIKAADAERKRGEGPAT
jgi:hypothetical protein